MNGTERTERRHLAPVPRTELSELVAGPIRQANWTERTLKRFLNDFELNLRHSDTTPHPRQLQYYLLGTSLLNLTGTLCGIPNSTANASPSESPTELNWTELSELGTELIECFKHGGPPLNELNELSRHTGDKGTELYWTDDKPFLTLNEKALQVHELFWPCKQC